MDLTSCLTLDHIPSKAGFCAKACHWGGAAHVAASACKEQGRVAGGRHYAELAAAVIVSTEAKPCPHALAAILVSWTAFVRFARLLTGWQNHVD